MTKARYSKSMATEPTGGEMQTAEQLVEQAKMKVMEAEASFERCDTDGFLSQWANRLGADFDMMQADILKKGGAVFPALFDLEGNLVKAKLIETKFGRSWAIVGDNGKFTGQFVSAFPKKRETMVKKGFVEGRVLQKAYAEYAGTSGNVFIVARPSKPVYEEPLEIITIDRWAEDV